MTAEAAPQDPYGGMKVIKEFSGPRITSDQVVFDLYRAINTLLNGVVSEPEPLTADEVPLSLEVEAMV